MAPGPVGFEGDVNIAEVGGTAIGNSVPVTIVGGGGGGGTEFAEDSAHTTGDLGTQILAVRNDGGGSLVDTDGDYASLQLDSQGRLRVTGGGGGTEFAEDSAHNTGDAGVQTLAVRNDTPGSLVSADGDYASLQLDAGGALRISIQNAAGVPASIGVEGASSQASLTVRSPYRVDDPQGPHSVWPIGLVRVDTLSTLGPVLGDYVHGRTNSRGAMWVEHDGSLSVDDGGGSITIDGTVAVSSVAGTVAVTQSGAWSVTIQEPLSVDDGGGSLTVDGAVSVSNFPATQNVDIVAQTVGALSIQDGGNVISVDDAGGSLTVDGTVAVSSVGGTVTVAGSVSVSNFPAVQPVSDNGGSLTVDGTVAVSSVAGNVVTATPYQRDQAVGAAPFVWPAGFRRRDSLATLAPTDGDWVLGNTTDRGAIWVTIDRVATSALGLGKVEDAAHASGDVGVMSLAVRNDTPSALAGTDGDYIPLTTDSVGALHVQARQATHGNLQANVTLQLQDVDIVAGAGLSTSRTVRVPVQSYGYNGLPQLTFPLAGAAETFGVSMVDPSAIQAAGVNAALGGLSGTGGGLRTGPDRDTYVSLFSGQVFNATTSANSSSLDVSTARWANIFLDIDTSAGTPTDIRLIPQFSPDSGTTWFDYSVDQWVDLRYVDAQMPVLEVIPLNYVIPGLFRLRAVATGTDGSNTFTLSADIQVVS